MPDGLAQDAHALEHFRRAAKAASALKRPNICNIHDIGNENGQPFIVMEFLEGATLRIAFGFQQVHPECRGYRTH